MNFSFSAASLQDPCHGSLRYSGSITRLCFGWVLFFSVLRWIRSLGTPEKERDREGNRNLESDAVWSMGRTTQKGYFLGEI